MTCLKIWQKIWQKFDKSDQYTSDKVLQLVNNQENAN